MRTRKIRSAISCSIKTLARKNITLGVAVNRTQGSAPSRPQIQTLFGGRIVPDPVVVDIINVLVSTVTSVLDIRLPNKWVRSAGGSTGAITPMWHPHAAPWGMQSERFNQQSLRERRGARRGNRWVGGRSDGDGGGGSSSSSSRRRAGLVG